MWDTVGFGLIPVATFGNSWKQYSLHLFRSSFRRPSSIERSRIYLSRSVFEHMPFIPVPGLLSCFWDYFFSPALLLGAREDVLNKIINMLPNGKSNIFSWHFCCLQEAINMGWNAWKLLRLLLIYSSNTTMSRQAQSLNNRSSKSAQTEHKSWNEEFHCEKIAACRWRGCVEAEECKRQAKPTRYTLGNYDYKLLAIQT